MKRSDIDDQHVIDLAQRWHDEPFRHPGVMAALVEEGIPPRLAEAKVLHLVRRGFLDYGVSANCAWPTGKTENVRAMLRALKLKHDGMEFQAALAQARAEIAAANLDREQRREIAAMAG